MRRRHRDWYEAMALDAETEWVSARQLDWIARLDREQPNLREALEFGIDDDPAAGLRTAAALRSGSGRRRASTTRVDAG